MRRSAIAGPLISPWGVAARPWFRRTRVRRRAGVSAAGQQHTLHCPAPLDCALHLAGRHDTTELWPLGPVCAAGVRGCRRCTHHLPALLPLAPSRSLQQACALKGCCGLTLHGRLTRDCHWAVGCHQPCVMMTRVPPANAVHLAPAARSTCCTRTRPRCVPAPGRCRCNKVMHLCPVSTTLLHAPRCSREPLLPLQCTTVDWRDPIKLLICDASL